MMNDHPQFDGIDYEFEHDGEGKLISCTSIIHRKDRAHPTRVTEYLAECRRNTEPWKMERRMLRHKATIQGARVAFGFSGITDEDEAAATPGLERDVTPKAARAVPLDPFAALPEPEQTPVIEAAADPMDDAALLDLLDIVNEAPDAATINKLIESVKTGFDGAKLDIAKRAINNRAKAICATWNTEGGQYE